MKTIKLLKPLTENHVSFRLESDLRAYYKPLGDKLNIKNFWYSIINHKTNRLNIITTSANCNKAVFDDKTFLNVGEIKSGIRYLAATDFSRARFEINKTFNIHNLMEFVEKRDDETIVYGFGTNRQEPEVLNDFLNSQHHFKHFIKNYEIDAADMLRHAKEDEIAISIPDGQPHPSNNMIMLASGEAVKLTNREREILKHLSCGLTAKSSAKKLGLSHRTVEAYIENIKNNLNVHRRSH